MSMIFFTYRSATRAKQGFRLLRNQGISVQLRKTPAVMATNGCSHSMVVPESFAPRAGRILREGGAMYERAYQLEGNVLREVQL